jgi:very-short-patch-repair endonuclease
MFEYVDWFNANLYNARGKLNPRASSSSWWTNFKDQYLDFINSTKWLGETSFAEKAYCYHNRLTMKPSCGSCQRPVKYNKAKRHYGEYCSPGCVTRDQKVLDKRCRTMTDRYGYLKNFSSDQHRNESNATMMTRWGVNHPMRSQELVNKLIDTHNIRYGCHYTQTEEYLHKKRATCIQRYGVDSHMKLDTYRVRAGAANRKITEEMKLQIRQDYQSGMAKQLVSAKYDFSLSHMNKILVSLGLDTDLPQNKINYSKFWVSSAEIELRQFLEQVYDGAILCNQRSLIWPYEVDIYLPKAKLAIEFNGTYWHSDLFKDKDYHKSKLEMLESIGIECMMIFEDVWNSRKDAVKGQIASRICQSLTIDNDICSVRCIDPEMSKEFTACNYIHGPVVGDINYGVYFGDKIVAYAGFIQCSDGSKMVGFCEDPQVSDTLAMILDHVSQSYQGSIYTTVDRCFTNRIRNIFLDQEFEEIQVTQPRSHTLQVGLKNQQRYWDCGDIIYRKFI